MDGTLLIRGGLVVNSRAVRSADVRIRSGIVTEVAPRLDSDGEEQEVIDARGLHVLPGVIDAHSHQWQAGFASRPDFRDDTSSAAAGGITTIIDHPLTYPEVLDANRLREKAALGETTAFIDFALHAGVTPGHLDAMDELWTAGATGFKLFTCDNGSTLHPFINPNDQRAVLRRVRSLGAIALVHAEDQTLLDRNRRRVTARGERDPKVFWEWRDHSVEIVAVDQLLVIAQETRGRIYFVHTSLPKAVAAIATVRQRGFPSYVETCPHYLWLTADDAARQWATSAPPVRDPESRDLLRAQLMTEISTIGSDHCSIPLGKKRTADPLASLPGLPGNETMLPIMLELVWQKFLTVERLVALVCERPAHLFGLSSRKGFLRPGADGDVTLVSMSDTTTPSRAALAMVAGWTPYEGTTLHGRVVKTIVRGRIVASDGTVTGKPGFGEFVRRSHPPKDF